MVPQVRTNIRARLRRRRARPTDKWHIDEVALKINGRPHWLWRAVHSKGMVLDILVQNRRNQEAAEAFLRRVLDAVGAAPRVVVTDKLTSYPPAVRHVLPQVDHRRHKGLNNRVENSHRPTRERERRMQRFKSAYQAQSFLEPFSAVFNHFRPRRHLLTATCYRAVIDERFRAWREIVSDPVLREGVTYSPSLATAGPGDTLSMLTCQSRLQFEWVGASNFLIV